MIKLYSSVMDPDSHRTRIVLAEKELPFTLIEVESDQKPTELLEINPYGSLPTIVDRDTVLFEAMVVNEYLDERYPHPPLKPGSPAERAQMRLSVLRIEKELYPLYRALEKAGEGDRKSALARLNEYLEALNSYLARHTYFVGDVYTLADVTIAPILWRLSPIGVDTSGWANLEEYMDRLFSRPAFERSLSEYEQMLHH